MPDEPRRCKPSISVERFRWVFAFWNGAILVFLQINGKVFILLYNAGRLYNVRSFHFISFVPDPRNDATVTFKPPYIETHLVLGNNSVHEPWCRGRVQTRSRPFADLFGVQISV